jgi:regulator of RNase E activity RraA
VRESIDLFLHVTNRVYSSAVKSAVWGGLMSYGAKARGAVGVVIEGRCRDVLEHRQAGFPVFAKGQSTLGQKPFTRPSELNVPLKIGGEEDGWPSTLVRPRDWIVADVDGVVVVPSEQMQAVKDLCKASREVDERCRIDIAAGKGIQETFKKHRGA